MPRVATLKKKTPYDSRTNTPLVLLWFSDNHAKHDNFKRIIQWKDRYSSYIDDILNCGDTILANLTTYASNMEPYFANGGKNVLIALGNHDVCSGSYSLYGWDGTLSITSIYDKFVGRLNIAGLGIVQPENVATKGLNFYYKDYDNRGKVRLIVVDTSIKTSDITLSGSGASTVETDNYNLEQETWFENTLEDARQNNYAVVVAAHAGGNITMIPTISGFSQDYDAADTPHNSMQPYLLEAVEQFISNGGEFVAWFVGHSHIDKIGTVKNHPNQLVLRITTSSSDRAAMYGQLPARVDGTKTQDAFNLVEVDTYYKEIRMVRVGTNFDTYGRPLDMITIDYENKTVK
mgnify:FL=1